MNKQQVFTEYALYLDKLCHNSLTFSSFLAKAYATDSFCVEDGYVAVGATRATIMKDNSPYVVKMDIDMDDWQESSCENECAIYDAAKARGLQRCFTEAAYLGIYRAEVDWYDLEDFSCYIELDDAAVKEKAARQGCELRHSVVEIPLYGYERAVCGFVHQPQSTEADRAFIKMHRSPLAERSEKVALSFLNEYGKEVYDMLTDLFFEYEVNDLHSGNIGYIEDRVVFTDFAGYHVNEY